MSPTYKLLSPSGTSPTTSTLAYPSPAPAQSQRQRWSLATVNSEQSHPTQSIKSAPRLLGYTWTRACPGLAMALVIFFFFGQYLKLFIRSNSQTTAGQGWTVGQQTVGRNSCWNSSLQRSAEQNRAEKSRANSSWGVSNVLVRFALFLSFFLSLLLLLFLSPTHFAFLSSCCFVFRTEELHQPSSLGFASQTSQAGPGERVFKRDERRLATAIYL